MNKRELRIEIKNLQYDIQALKNKCLMFGAAFNKLGLYFPDFTFDTFPKMLDHGLLQSLAKEIGCMIVEQPAESASLGLCKVDREKK